MPMMWTYGMHRKPEDGDRVRRGPHWKYCDQDGGVGKIGIVQSQSKSNTNWWEVKWIENGHENSYEYHDGCYTIEIEVPDIEAQKKAEADEALVAKLERERAKKEKQMLERLEKERLEIALEGEGFLRRKREQELKSLQKLFDALQAKHVHLTGKWTSYVSKQENGLDHLLTEISFALVDKQQTPLLAEYKAILEDHLQSSFQELKSIVALENSSASASSKENDDHHVISFDALTVQREIGQGGFGTVYLCDFKNGPDASLIALKVPAQTSRKALEIGHKQEPKAETVVSASEKAVRKALLNEIATFRRLDHPNIIKYLGTTVESSPSRAICIVQQYCAGGDLHSLLFKKKSPVVNEKFVFQAALQITGALSALHSLGVVHRDLKLAQILLLNFPAEVLDVPIFKLTDLGSASLRQLNEELSVLTGGGGSSASAAPSAGATGVNAFSQRYMAPELLKRRLKDAWKDSFAQDLWSFGLILFSLCTRCLPYKDDDELTVISAIVEGESPGTWPSASSSASQEDWKWLRQVADLCLTISPQERLAHFSALGAREDGRDAFSFIEKKLCQLKPEWAKEVVRNVLRFQRMEIRDPFLKDQVM